MKTAIVCEGGGMRGVFTAGVLQAFMEADFLADGLIGVSAGASNGASYVSHQLGRGYRTNVDYCGDKRYMSTRNFIREGSLFGMDFVFGELPNALDPFDFDAFCASRCAYWAGATDMETGKPEFFAKSQVDKSWDVVKASCSLPLLSHPVEINGRLYLDGGIAAPIPLDKALEEGFEKLVVILTRPRGYTKKPQGMRAVYHAKYRKWPHFVKAMDLRHLVYNHTLERLWRLEAQGKAVIVLPPEPLPVDRFGSDKDKMIESYWAGHAAGQAALPKL